jgi:hypothetical protein
MSETLACWRCGAGLEALSLPLARMDECPECAIHLHVCRMCINYDPVITRSCREDDAEEVLEKERANFCDYFQPSAAAFDRGIAAADQKAKGELQALFGAGEAGDPDQAEAADHNPADDLFK